ncbi:hypothetical protein CORC01_11651, partial [Colletotrichum orchidophilum]
QQNRRPSRLFVPFVVHVCGVRKVRCPRPHQSARHPRVHVPFGMGGPWTRTDDAEVASRLGAPSPANHRSPIASPSRPFVSFLFLLCLFLRLDSVPSSLLPLHHHLLTGVHSQHRHLSLVSYTRPWTLASFFQPLSLSVFACLAVEETLSHSNTLSNYHNLRHPLLNIGSRPASADPSLSAYKRPYTGSSHRHPPGSAKAPRCQPLFPFFPG